MPLVYKNPKVSFSNRELNTKMTRLRKELCKYNEDIRYKSAKLCFFFFNKANEATKFIHH